MKTIINKSLIAVLLMAMSWTAMATVEVCTTAECYQSAIEDGNYRKVLEDFVAISDEETDKTTTEAVRYVLENEGLENIVEFLARYIAFNDSATGNQRKSANMANSFDVLDLLSLSYLIEESLNEKLITAIINDEDSEVIANIQTSLRYWEHLTRLTLRRGLNSDSEEIRNAVSDLAIENGDAQLVSAIEVTQTLIVPTYLHQFDKSKSLCVSKEDEIVYEETAPNSLIEALLAQHRPKVYASLYVDRSFKAFLRDATSKCN